VSRLTPRLAQTEHEKRLYVEIEGLYCQRAMRRASLPELDALFAAFSTWVPGSNSCHAKGPQQIRLWRKNQAEAAKAKVRQAAIAYVTRDLVGFEKGDGLVTDASKRAVRMARLPPSSSPPCFGRCGAV